MEHKVTGCDDCPYFSPEGGTNYKAVCTHPLKPVRYGIWHMAHFYELPHQFVPDGLYKCEGYSVSFKTEPLEINENKNYDPITPKWCPLLKESITVSITN